MTKSKTKTESAAIVEPDIDTTVEALQPFLARLVILLGRGNRGKTTLGRYVAEEAYAAGRDPLIADADRNNDTLSRFFPHVVSPESADEKDVESFIARLIENMVATGRSTLLDLTGGDTVLKRLAGDMQLSTWLPSVGIEPVAVHVLGPNSDDCAFLRSTEHERLFAPPATALVLNAGVVPQGISPEEAFHRTVSENPVIVATVERGARIVTMPRLACATEVEERRLSFADAAANRDPNGGQALGLWKAQQVTLWRRAMELNFASIKEWML
ncbi:hypothetical protein ABEV34_19340 [Methylorubrum rhodesianum]|jgi:hypothetical protein|uniref:hypothetical protein n=1 Tax=Methylorubrum rhodesianum TaxID=29427 RepID=UPI002882B9A2|nr:hypothetical protein [Microbacterium sp. ARD31]MDT0188533.1 hypothetical protein [Microbacterium sp. ARD31]MDV2988410.1 hypothetical protein [Methylobacteriaceae bacterium AG10]